MAIQTRYAGDAQGVNNVDAKTDGTLATIIATGLTKNPTALKVITPAGVTNQVADSATGGNVEAILRSISIDSTVVMYQVDTDRISVLLEAQGSATSAIQTRIQALTNMGTATVTSANGFKLA
jgi:hypothetical protein